jgi:hypothetical protein
MIAGTRKAPLCRGEIGDCTRGNNCGQTGFGCAVLAED